MGALLSSIVYDNAPVNFTYKHDCYIHTTGNPLYYVLMNSARELVSEGSVQGGKVECPPDRGVYFYRVVFTDGSVAQIPVCIHAPYVWAEANRTTAYVKRGEVESVSFDLYHSQTHTPVTHRLSMAMSYNTTQIYSNAPAV